MARGLQDKVRNRDPSVGAKELQAAILLHFEVVARVSLSGRDREGQLKAAAQLLDSPRRFVPIEMERRFRLVQIALYQRESAIEDVARALGDALERFDRDSDLLLAQGSLWELLATSPEPEAIRLPNTAAVGPILILSPKGLENVPVGINKEAIYARCLRLYEGLLATEPGLLEVRVRLGAVLSRMARPVEALAALQPLVRRASELPRYLRYQAGLIAARAMLDSGDAASAVEAIESATELFPGCQTPWLARSLALRATGAREQAQRAVSRALELAASAECPDDPWLQYHQGQAWRLDEWLERLERAVRE
jgi:tetratricopeptide (TPR) repeat protein